MSENAARPFLRTARLGAGLGVLGMVVLVGLRGYRAPVDAEVQDRPDVHPADAPSADAGPTAAGLMVDRLQLFRTGNGGGRLELDGRELTAILRHAVPGVIPAGVTDPSVRIVDGEVRVHAHVSPTLVPGGGYLTEAFEKLPEWVEVELRGRVETEHLSWIVYRVDDVVVEGVALPRGVVSLVIGAIDARGGVPTESPPGDPVLRMRWPADVGVLSVVSDHIVLERAEPLLQQSVDGSGGV